MSLNKTAIDEANRQLHGMYQQMTEQEKKFKTELHEKEQEIVRLHTILRETERSAHEHRAAAAAKDAEIAALKGRLDQIAAIAAGDGAASANGGALPGLGAGSIVTPSKIVTLPSSEGRSFTID